MKNLEKLRASLAGVIAKMAALNALVGGDSPRDFTAEEQSSYDGFKADMNRFKGAIVREEEVAAADAIAKVVATVPGNGDQRIELGVDRKDLDKTRGFKSIGEFCLAVRSAGLKSDARVDDRLKLSAAAPTTFGNEAVGSDGGFLVPPQFSTDIFRLSLEDEALLPMTDNVELSNTNSMVFPKDETTPWGTNGVRAFWQSEGTAATQTKPVFGTQSMRLHKLMALVPMTDELLSDSSAAGSYITPLIARSIQWKTNEAILLGTGAGQPLGFVTNAGGTGACAVIQAKESGQATLTVLPLNIANMIARLPAGAYANAVWLITPDAFPSIITLTLGNYPIYLPVNQGIQGAPYGTLMGRPIHLSQHVGAFSAQGDITLIAPQWYRTITAAGGVQMATSLHLYFDADATAFRATFRLDGGPKLVAPISQAKGSRTLSPAIQLQNR